jgi:hypothetical protein
MMNVTIKEDCKSVLLDNGIAPPMLMDIEAFIQMAVEARNDFSLRNADLEAQLALTGKALELAVERLYDFYHHDCDLCPVDYVALCRFGPIRDCWQHIGDQIINEAKEALSDGTI